MRLYNGAPDSELKDKWKREDAARARLAKLGGHVTYFPMEGKWLAFHANHLSIGDMHDNLIVACDRAIELLKPVACCDEGCGWRGRVEECSYLGSVGPLCPRCRETTEPIKKEKANDT